MTINTQTTAEEVTARGEAIYQTRIKERLTDADMGKYLIIDIGTDDYELGEEHLTTARRLRERRPDGVFYAMKIGYPGLGRIGGRLDPAVKP